ncbi:GNAT family N-acetyltransferase [Streptococcus suis]|uniref:N-acetyltransferase GCN5 n=1 Tax=Streptococcus suis TaxID=1307 RepID=A0AAN2RG60_STRSU|nr:GNAT family N-acetyltransferase [Streptococcus suis]MCO8221299.1 GNAT family N-acetyltransferase [Streptococcus suis]NQH73637.1 GNAT family N-acetyltransferase [Streptococcus suis]CYU71643.1 N-acetyltransferase GCN5 [Streptococcus suis]HEL2150501.1 GNAT family N-acetyltransferase [Streptococcus suis]HEM3512927.1 GNAT family N-acetyltransferase [Streptococcus suis]
MIRKFQKEDIETIVQLWLSVNVETHAFIPAEYWESKIDFVTSQLLDAEIYVYVFEERIVGFIGMQGTYLAGIFVSKDLRRRGFGRELLNFVKAIHPTIQLNVYQKNQKAISFYLGEGFSIISEKIDNNTQELELSMVWTKLLEEKSC